MAIPYFTDDVEIIRKLGTHPNTDNNLGEQALKEKFDEASVRIKDYLNNQLIPSLSSGNVETAVLYSKQTLTSDQQEQARKNIGAMKVQQEISRELFFSGEADDFEPFGGGLMVHITRGVQDWLNSPEDFDFRVRFSISNGVAGTDEYEFTKADCTIHEPIRGKKCWNFYAADKNGTMLNVLTIANGLTPDYYESDNNFYLTYTSVLENYSVDFYKVSVGQELNVVTSVNGVAPDENGNVKVGGNSKTLLWTFPRSVSFNINTLYLPIGGYDAIEILYEDPCGAKNIQSSGEIPLIDGYTSYCPLFSYSGTFYTYVAISNDGKFTFTLKDNEECTPKFIYGIKYANPVVQSDNALASAGFKVDTIIEVNGTDFDEVEGEVGFDVTGYIEVSAGDVIRLKNVTMPDTAGDSNRVFCYNPNKLERNYFSVRSTDTSRSPVFEDGNVVQFTVLENDIGGTTGYIRIGAKNIDKYSIITVNKEIE